MQGPNKLFDDFSKMMSNAMGVAQGAKTEAETAMKGWVDRWMADRDFVTREEFDAVRAMAQKAREENSALAARIAALEGGKAKPTAKPAAEKAATKPAAEPVAKPAAAKPVRKPAARPKT